MWQINKMNDKENSSNYKTQLIAIAQASIGLTFDIKLHITQKVV